MSRFNHPNLTGILTSVFFFSNSKRLFHAVSTAKGYTQGSRADLFTNFKPAGSFALHNN